MPFIRPFEDTGDFDQEETTPEGYAYVPPEAYRYKDVKERMSDSAQLIREVLLALGATEFHVDYDGGSDEGFAHPDAFRVAGELRPVDAVITDLVRPEIVRKLREGAPYPHHVYAQQRSDRQIIEYGVEELAEECAARLLGRGYGTGEYEMYGTFVVDLRTLEMSDDENATPKGGA